MCSALLRDFFLPKKNCEMELLVEDTLLLVRFVNEVPMFVSSSSSSSTSSSSSWSSRLVEVLQIMNSMSSPLYPVKACFSFQTMLILPHTESVTKLETGELATRTSQWWYFWPARAGGKPRTSTTLTANIRSNMGTLPSISSAFEAWTRPILHNLRVRCNTCWSESVKYTSLDRRGSQRPRAGTGSCFVNSSACFPASNAAMRHPVAHTSSRPS
mmetsp:Transcript_147575/g.383732  ORF Transcript_147575/g.383732 Transcript_147575/m.383732 type:complete len:214 (-) Transcript_147575:776-1417(-)